MIDSILKVKRYIGAINTSSQSLLSPLWTSSTLIQVIEYFLPKINYDNTSRTKIPWREEWVVNSVFRDHDFMNVSGISVSLWLLNISTVFQAEIYIQYGNNFLCFHFEYKFLPERAVIFLYDGCWYMYMQQLRHWIWV